MGSAIMWARFYALDLPATRGVSLLPREFLLSVGASTLVLSMLLGVLAVVLLYGIRSALPPDVRHVGSYILIFCLELFLLLVLLSVSLSGGQRLLILAAGMAAGIAFAVIEANVASFRRVGLGLFFLITVLGGVLGFVRNYAPPVRLDTAILLLKDGTLTSGAYIASTSDEIYLAPDSFNRTYGQLVAIPREDVTRISLAEPQHFRSAGASDPRPLVGLRSERAVPSGERVRQVERYLAAWAGDPMWKYPPISFVESEDYLRLHLDEFVPSGEQSWSRAGIEVPLGRLVDTARGYSGQAVITGGRLVQVISPPNQPPHATARFLVVEEHRRSPARAICAVITGPSRSFRLGQQVNCRGVVVDAGTLATSAKGGVKGVFMQCSAVRVLPTGRS